MKRKRKKEKTNQRAPRVRGRKNGAAARPRVCQREGGSIYLLGEEKRSGKREKRKEKKKRTIRKGGGVSQSVGREEGAS
jgi:hypothetical protein